MSCQTESWEIRVFLHFFTNDPLGLCKLLLQLWYSQSRAGERYFRKDASVCSCWFLRLDATTLVNAAFGCSPLKDILHMLTHFDPSTCKLDVLNQHLQRWVEIAQNHPRKSLERRQALTRLILLVQNSGRLWQGGTSTREDYEEALQKTWLWICTKIEDYDPTRVNRATGQRTTVMAWINSTLKFRLLDLQLERQKSMQRQAVTTPSLEQTSPQDWMAQIPAPPTPDPLFSLIEEWLQTNAKPLTRIYVTDRPDINCHVIIRHRLPPETDWKRLSQNYQIPISTLSNFYQRKCLPQLRAFLESQGYS